MSILRDLGSRIIGSMKISVGVAALFGLGFGAQVQAVPATVKEISVSPARVVTVEMSGFYSGGVYAGIVNMEVDGIGMQGFCIDPFHFSSRSALNYEMVALSDAPKAYLPHFTGNMGAEKAEQISKLWGLAFSPSMTANAAAAMQLAIWEIVAGDLFTIKSSTDYGAGALLAQLHSYEGPKADLIALTGDGQDYVIARVPEGGATLILLGLGLCAIGLFRLRQLSCEA